jgi:peroxiredoxin
VAPEKPEPGSDTTTWKVITVATLIFGAVLAWQILRGSAPAAAPTPPPSTAADAASAPAQPAPVAGPVTADRGKNKQGRQLPPDFWLPELSTGKQIKLSAFKGKVVLVDFWATWCGPCRMELPEFVELHNAYKRKGFSMIGVSLDQQGPAVVKNFITQWKITYPIVVDSTQEVGMAYGGIRSIPTSLLIGRDGTVRDVFVGYRQKEVFEEAIQKALAEGDSGPDSAAPKKS